jgi:hypothetical protein
MMTTICPHCDALSNHQTPVSEGIDTPENGDASICAACGEVSVFDDACPTNLRLPTDDEQAEITACPEVSEGRAVIAARSMR